jgi:hypothetical protein
MPKIPLILLPGIVCDEENWQYQVAHLQDLAECIIPSLSKADTPQAMVDTQSWRVLKHHWYNGKYIYPGKMIVGANHKIVYMNKNKLQLMYFQPIIDWQRKYHISASQIFAEEFGAIVFQINNLVKNTKLFI